MYVKFNKLNPCKFRCAKIAAIFAFISKHKPKAGKSPERAREKTDFRYPVKKVLKYLTTPRKEKYKRHRQALSNFHINPDAEEKEWGQRESESGLKFYLGTFRRLCLVGHLSWAYAFRDRGPKTTREKSLTLVLETFGSMFKKSGKQTVGEGEKIYVRCAERKLAISI